MEIKKCQSYYAKLVGKELIEMPDGKSFFKIYFLSIVGRNNPEKFEWNTALNQHLALLEKLKALKLEGVGFITAFPHITKVFRFAPSSEIVIHVKAFNTQELVEILLAREHNFFEFACLAEAVIASAEYECWARVDSMDEYKKFFCSTLEFPIKNHSKMYAYYA